MSNYILKVAVGEYGENIHGDIYEITELIEGSKRQVKVRFIETGYETETYSSNLYKGHINDRFKKTIFGVGALGYRRDWKDPHYKKIYTHWECMIRRCYSPEYKQYNNYGGEGVRVCERWHYFHNFYDDFRELDGYSEEIMQVEKLRHLDKDIKQQFMHNSVKIYSPRTCKLVLKEENEKYKRMKERPYVKATNPAGTEFYFNNTTEFSRKVNQRIRNKYITYCLSGKQEHHLGWKFERVNQVDYEKFHKEKPDAPEYPQKQDLFYVIKPNHRHRMRADDVLYDPEIHKKRY